MNRNGGNSSVFGIHLHVLCTVVSPISHQEAGAICVEAMLVGMDMGEPDVNPRPSVYPQQSVSEMNQRLHPV